MVVTGVYGLYITHPANGTGRSPTVLMETTMSPGTVVDTVTASGSGTITYAIWSQTGSIGAALQINSATGEITIADGSAIDYEFSTEFYVSLNVSNGTTNIYGTLIFNLTDVNDCPPKFDPSVNTTMFYIPDGSTAGALLTELNATDADRTSPNNQISSYQILSGNTGDAFVISNLNRVVVASGYSIRSLETPEFEIVVTAIDAGTPAITGSTTLHVIVCSTCPGSKSSMTQAMTSLVFVITGILSCFMF